MCIEVYNNIVKDLNISVKMLITIFLIFMLFMTDSIYFLAFEFVLVLILILLSNESIKKFVKSLKIFLCLLPFIILIYFIFKNNIFLLSSRIIISILLLKVFFLTTSFLGLYNGLFTLINLYYKNNEKLNIKCLNISTKLYFFDKLLGENDKFERAINKGLEKKQIKNFLRTKYLMAKYDSIFIKNKLKLKIYQAKSEKINIKSKVCLILSIVLMILVVIKGVI